ncbi:MAG: hypothetical protein HQ500_06230 [Flavobacteriales bacterium]|nr:hypothetical protein [Flavobacteriales bacterium]
MRRLNDTWVRWQSKLEILPVSEVFIRAIYLTLIWSTIKLLLIGDVVWGEEWLHVLYTPFGNIDRFAMILNETAVRPYYLWFVVPFLALLIGGLLGLHNFFTRAVVWYLYVALHFGNVEISTGGHHLYQQLLFFHILFFRVSDRAGGIWAATRRLLHHLGFYAIWVNIALLYFASAYWKTFGEMWFSGQAMLMSISFEAYSFPGILALLPSNTWYLLIGTYAVFAYQLLFAIAIWIKPVRKPFLLFGLLFHLSIVFIVGLADFGVFMIASYSIFLAPSDARMLMERLSVIRLSRK